MSKRHNRKRTRSRPRHRDGSKAHSNHNRTLSVGTDSSSGTFHSSFPMPHIQHYPIASVSPDHWHQTYATWQNRLRFEQEQARAQSAIDAYRMRIFGGEAGDETSLIEPMLKVVTDLFDGNTDYEDP